MRRTFTTLRNMKQTSRTLDQRRLDVYAVTVARRRVKANRVVRRAPGQIRDAILAVVSSRRHGASVAEISEGVSGLIGRVPQSSVRSYLRLNTDKVFRRERRGVYTIAGTHDSPSKSIGHQKKSSNAFRFGKATLFADDCLQWLSKQSENSIHAVVTDPPYGLVEYSAEQQEKLRHGRGGVWRIPPSFDGTQRAPLPRFTVLTREEIDELSRFFFDWAKALVPVLVPGANVVVASNPLLSHLISVALANGGLERRGEVIRLVMTMRGGDRPKHAHEEFSGVSVLPRSMWEPWLLFRKPVEGRVQDNLRRWKTGGFRRPSGEKPFGDVIPSSPTHKNERALAPHPSLKPQSFLRTLVRGVLPLGEGIILDPFAGSGSTLAAAEAVGYASVGVERDPRYFQLATASIPKLAAYKNGSGEYLFTV
jgi:site-specific DNA-methyltransferase (adenine-specific)